MFRSDAGRLAIVHQRCAGHLTTRVTAPINWCACSRVVLAATAVALLSIAVVVAYAMLLSAEGISASTLCLLAVLLAATLSSIAGFAFSAVCGVMLLQPFRGEAASLRITRACHDGDTCTVVASKQHIRQGLASVGLHRQGALLGSSAGLT